MTTNDALTNPLTATLPVPDVPSILLYHSTLAIKMAGHAVVGVLVRRRPRAVWMYLRDGMYGVYRLDRPRANAELSAMVALGGYVALNIAKSMGEPLAKGVCETALCTDVHHASMYFSKEANRPAAAMMHLPVVRDILGLAWDKVKIVAAHLAEHWMIDGPTLGRLVLADENIAEPGPQVVDAQVSSIASPTAPMTTVEAHEGAAVRDAESTQVNPTESQWIAGKYDVEFLRDVLEGIASKKLSFEDGVVLLEPTRLQELVLRAIARGGMTLDVALEVFSATSSQE